MGRPKGALNKATLLQQQVQALGGAPPIEVNDPRTDTEVLSEISDRFNIYLQLIGGATEADAIPGLIVSGAAGVSKSYTAEWALENHKKKYGIRYRVIKGTISPIDLYAQAYEMCNAGDVIVLDDADGIFNDEQGLNILKSLLDTSVNRKVNWMTDHSRFNDSGKRAQKGRTLPKEFIYRGSMIFLTNRNFQKEVERGSMHTEHMMALLSRAIYLDLRMHSRREVALWARHIVLNNKILQQIGLSATNELMLMDWLVDNMNNLREMSIRTAIKLGRLFNMSPTKWELSARVTLLR